MSTYPEENLVGMCVSCRGMFNILVMAETASWECMSVGGLLNSATFPATYGVYDRDIRQMIVLCVYRRDVDILLAIDMQKIGMIP